MRNGSHSVEHEVEHDRVEENEVEFLLEVNELAHAGSDLFGSLGFG